MSSCCLFKDEFLGSCTKKLLVGGINIRNISTKAWSNLNEESIQQLRNFCLLFVFCPWYCISFITVLFDFRDVNSLIVFQVLR